MVDASGTDVDRRTDAASSDIPPPPRVEAEPAPPRTEPMTIAESVRSIAVIGASASDGFGARVYADVDGRTTVRAVGLAEILAALINDPGLTITDHASSQFFMQPFAMGEKQIVAALADTPDIVCAVDYLFWFSYGSVGVEPGTDAERDRRFALLERGLKILDRTKAEIVIGNLPDVSVAIGGMLRAQQVPSPEVLAELNERIVRWADERPRVTLIDLADMMNDLLAGGRAGAPGKRPLMNRDRLHPTADGIAVIARAVARAAELPDVDHAEIMRRLESPPNAQEADAEGAQENPGAPDAPGS